jgi:Co/Zn/Cd efflux system component
MHNYIINKEPTEEIQDINRIQKNKNFLILTSILFTLFMLSEIGGALESNSLSLLGDAMAMSIDVANYVTNIYIENLKKKYNQLSLKVRWNAEVLVPFLAVNSLLAVSFWIFSDAIIIIINPPEITIVDISFLYGYASVNIIIDIICNYSFFSNGFNVFYNSLKPISNQEVKTYNLNMWSAFTHMFGDTLRSFSVLLAALISTFTDISGDICDAWASIICTITIFILAIPLLFHIYQSNKAFYYECKENQEAIKEENQEAIKEEDLVIKL